jgi:hypothetical protein
MNRQHGPGRRGQVGVAQVPLEVRDAAHSLDEPIARPDPGAHPLVGRSVEVPAERGREQRVVIRTQGRDQRVDRPAIELHITVFKKIGVWQ